MCIVLVPSATMGLGRNISGSVMRLGRCVVFLAAAAFLLSFTILLILMADLQYNLTNKSKGMFYQEFISGNGTYDENLLTREKFLEVGARMERRHAYLRNECSKLDSSSYKANTWEYLVNRQYHVIWCKVFKAASSSWIYNFNLMANYSASFLNKPKQVPLELARRKYGRPSVAVIKKAQADSITFIIVRHPLERLASAYNNKIVHAFPKSFHDKLGKKIIEKYRKNAQLQWTVLYPLFEEFVMYLVDEWNGKRSLDNHWTPYTVLCTPCKFNFDVILKFETLDEDQRFLIQLARLQNVVKPEWRNRGKANTLHDINHLYSQIKKSQLDSLYRMYIYDLKLFNYSIENYYKIVKADETGSDR